MKTLLFLKTTLIVIGVTLLSPCITLLAQTRNGVTDFGLSPYEGVAINDAKGYLAAVRIEIKNEYSAIFQEVKKAKNQSDWANSVVINSQTMKIAEKLYTNEFSSGATAATWVICRAPDSSAMGANGWQVWVSLGWEELLYLAKPGYSLGTLSKAGILKIKPTDIDGYLLFGVPEGNIVKWYVLAGEKGNGKGDVAGIGKEATGLDDKGKYLNEGYCAFILGFGLGKIWGENAPGWGAGNVVGMWSDASYYGSSAILYCYGADTVFNGQGQPYVDNSGGYSHIGDMRDSFDNYYECSPYPKNGDWYLSRIKNVVAWRSKNGNGTKKTPLVSGNDYMGYELEHITENNSYNNYDFDINRKATVGQQFPKGTIVVFYANQGRFSLPEGMFGNLGKPVLRTGGK